MDPNLFHLDWARTFEVLIGVVVLSFLVERALSPLFESRAFVSKAKGKSLKELIAFVVGAVVCVLWQFDAFSIVFLTEHTTRIGAVLTGAIVAGGSKASVKLFRDVLGFKSAAYKEYESQKPSAQ